MLADDLQQIEFNSLEMNTANSWMLVLLTFIYFYSSVSQDEMFYLAKVGELDNVALFMAAQSLYRLRHTEFSASCHPGSLRLFALVSCLFMSHFRQ